MNVLVLMGGGSQVFEEAGFAYPKSLIEVEGKPVVQRVIESLSSAVKQLKARQVFLVNREEIRRFHTAKVIQLLDPKAVVLEIPQETAGAACTALLAVEFVDNDEPLLVVNGDDILETDLFEIVSDFDRRELDGGIVVFESVHPRWSYVRCDSSGRVVEASEKRPISQLATTGTYYFKHGKLLVSAIKAMIRKGATVNGRFYVCPCFNEMVLEGMNLGVHSIDPSKYKPLKNPQTVKAYADELRAARLGGYAG